MTQYRSNQKNKIWKILILLLSIIGLIVCVTVLFPHVRRMIVDFAIQISHREDPIYPSSWLGALLSYAMGGICFILFFDYCTLTDSGKRLVQTVKREVIDCLSEVDFRSLLKPVLIMSTVYLLGILTIIRANYSYRDDLGRSIFGYRKWYDWSRYVSEFSSIFVNADANLTDISPVPQLLAVLILAISSVLLVYIIGSKKITTIRLLASIPLGLSPYFLECLAFKFDAYHMALSIFASIFPFLFIARKKAFLFVSIVSLLIMCMTYQAASGIYVLIVVILCFQDWNSRKKTNKEILSFLGMATLAFCLAMLLFRFFLMRPYGIEEFYASTAMHPLSNLISGTLSNIKNYAMVINHDFGIIWKIGILIILFFFIIKSIYRSAQKRIFSFLVSILFIALSFILSFGIYSLLALPVFAPRSMFGFGLFLSIICIYIVSDYKKIAIGAVLALNWCFFVFAFSYGNAISDQVRYAEFRASILLHDLNALYPNWINEDISFRFQNTIDFTPTIKNIAKHNPVIEKMIQKRLGDTDMYWDQYYFLDHFNFNFKYHLKKPDCDSSIDSNPTTILDSYYHTIRSEGNLVIIILKN